MFKTSQALALFLLAGNPLAQAGILPNAGRQAAPAPPAASDLPTGWSYTGCYIDSVSARTLSAAYQPPAFYSRIETCISFCTSKGFPVAGLEYGGECFCGATLPATAVAEPVGCTMPCRGNAAQACGAGNRLSVYTGPAQLGPVENPGVGGFASLGCYTDRVSARTLSRQASVPGGADVMTNAACAAACANEQYYGVEYGGELPLDRRRRRR
ncbi:WSC domain-domain-containing protein [Microdochium bolleyi]|uniref:WSC domain-domain-containing protein n=1 Tax=Microdochium bolleyi TaxID=196109 RepID=A0A136JGL9_9PEZI|nr:WSC domain-domain-containing protein [Microdochium bolleyi]